MKKDYFKSFSLIIFLPRILALLASFFMSSLILASSNFINSLIAELPILILFLANSCFRAFDICLNTFKTFDLRAED
jgi:hypothetical protein